MYRATYKLTIVVMLVYALTGCAAGTAATPGVATPAPFAGPTVAVPGAATPAPGVTRSPLNVATPTGGVKPPGPSTRYVYKQPAAHTPSCAHTGRAIALPRSFPASFPVPPGTSITSQIGYRGDNTRPVISGVIPSASFGSTVTFFLTQLPRAGYSIRNGESEAFEAESVFLGHGYIGRWRVRALDTCSAAMLLFVFAEKYPSPAR